VSKREQIHTAHTTRTLENLASYLQTNVTSGKNDILTLRIAFREELDLQVANNKASIFRLDGLVEGTMNRIVLKLVDGILKRQKGIVDSNDGGVGVVQSGTQDETTDTTKSIDSKCDGHGVKFLGRYTLVRIKRKA